MSDERTCADILRAAKVRIEDQGHFVMGELAWNRQGRKVDPLSEEAWRWNPRGALLTVADRTTADRLYRFIDEAAWAVAKTNGMFYPAGTDVADNLGHALAMQAFDRAIALAEADGGGL